MTKETKKRQLFMSLYIFRCKTKLAKFKRVKKADEEANISAEAIKDMVTKFKASDVVKLRIFVQYFHLYYLVIAIISSLVSSRPLFRFFPFSATEYNFS